MIPQTDLDDDFYISGFERRFSGFFPTAQITILAFSVGGLKNIISNIAPSSILELIYN
jgi:hypothetical protein